MIAPRCEVYSEKRKRNCRNVGAVQIGANMLCEYHATELRDGGTVQFHKGGAFVPLAEVEQGGDGVGTVAREDWNVRDIPLEDAPPASPPPPPSPAGRVELPADLFALPQHAGPESEDVDVRAPGEVNLDELESVARANIGKVPDDIAKAEQVGARVAMGTYTWTTKSAAGLLVQLNAKFRKDGKDVLTPEELASGAEPLAQILNDIFSGKVNNPYMALGIWAAMAFGTRYGVGGIVSWIINAATKPFRAPRARTRDVRETVPATNGARVHIVEDDDDEETFYDDDE